MKKFLTCLCVICMVFSTGTIAFATVHDSEDEPNDSMSSANYYMLKGYEAYKVYGIVSQNDDEDWFEIKSDVSGKSDIKLNIYDSRMNYDLYLYNSNGNLMTSSTKGTGEDESIRYIYIDANESYYVKVKYVSGGFSNQPYKLHLEVDHQKSITNNHIFYKSQIPITDLNDKIIYIEQTVYNRRFVLYKVQFKVLIENT